MIKNSYLLEWWEMRYYNYEPHERWVDSYNKTLAIQSIKKEIPKAKHFEVKKEILKK